MSDLALGLVTAGVVVAGGYFLYSAYDVNSASAPSKTPTGKPSSPSAPTPITPTSDSDKSGSDFLNSIGDARDAVIDWITNAPPEVNTKPGVSYIRTPDGPVEVDPPYVPPIPTPAQAAQIDLYTSVKNNGGSDEQAADVVANANLAVAILQDPTYATSGNVSLDQVAAASQTLVDISNGNYSVAATANLQMKSNPSPDSGYYALSLSPFPFATNTATTGTTTPTPSVFFSDADAAAVTAKIDANYNKWLQSQSRSPYFAFQGLSASSYSDQKTLDATIASYIATINNHTSQPKDLGTAVAGLKDLEQGSFFIGTTKQQEAMAQTFGLVGKSSFDKIAQNEGALYMTTPFSTVQAQSMLITNFLANN